MPVLEDEGTYEASMIGITPGTSRGGHTQVAIRYEVETGETITGYHYLTTSNGVNRNLLEKLEGIGWDGYDIAEIPDQLRGCACQIVVEEENTDNGARLRVQWVNPLSGGGADGLERARQKWFDLTQNKERGRSRDHDGDDDRRQNNRERDAQRLRGPARSRSSQDGPPNDDDVPF